MQFEKANQQDVYIFQDVETTGLDSLEDSMLQIAAIATSATLVELDEFETLIAPFPGALDRMSDYVRNMHTENGLLERIETENPPDVLKVGNIFCNWLENLKKPGGNLYFVGNSIHGVDWPFTVKDTPQIYMNHGGPVHYRAIDVTGLRLTLAQWTGLDFAYEKNNTHTAMEDARECLEEYKFLKKCTEDYFFETFKESMHTPPSVL